MSKGPAGTRRVELADADEVRGAIDWTTYIVARQAASDERKW